MGSSRGGSERERGACSSEVDSPSRHGARGHWRLGERLDSAPPLDARPPRGGARRRGRTHPSHPRGSPSPRPAQEVPQLGQSGGCTLHVAFWPPPWTSAPGSHAVEAALAGGPVDADERLVCALVSHCRSRGHRDPVAVKLPDSGGCPGSLPTFLLNPTSPIPWISFRSVPEPVVTLSRASKGRTRPRHWAERSC